MVIVRGRKKKALAGEGRERSLIIREQLSGTGLWKCHDYKGLARKKDKGAVERAENSSREWGDEIFSGILFIIPRTKNNRELIQVA